MPFVQTNVNEDFRTKLEKNLLQTRTCCSSISTKMELLFKLSKLTSNDYRLRDSLCNFVQRTLKPYYPHCEVYIFGSSNNGLGAKDCDVDLLFLPHPDYCHVGLEDPDEVPSANQVKTGEIHPSYLFTLGQKSQLMFLRKVLKKIPNHFFRILFIPAKVPILNFFYKNFGYQFICDLSCQNKLVVYNTELLRVLASFDNRVCPLVFTLCSWAKSMKHIQSLNFTTYAFTLMIVFFLQTRDPPILPSVKTLMSVAVPTQVANWKVGTKYDISKLSKSENLSNNEQLLVQFFYYYWNFEFNVNLIHVLTGNTVPKVSVNTAEDEYKDFDLSAVCVQDPFNLSHNVTRNVQSKALRSLKLSMYEALKILKNPVGRESNFEQLFDESRYPLSKEFNSAFNKQSFVLDMNYNIASALEKVKIDKCMWYNYLSDVIFQILNECLLFECEVVNKIVRDTESKSHQNGESFNLSNTPLDNMALTSSIQCAVFSRVWSDRKTVTEKVESQVSEGFVSVIDKEEYISKHIEENPLLSNSTPLLWFLCNCYKSNIPQIPCLVVEFTPLTVCKEFKALAGFLIHFIPKTLQTFLNQ